MKKKVKTNNDQTKKNNERIKNEKGKVKKRNKIRV